MNRRFAIGIVLALAAAACGERTPAPVPDPADGVLLNGAVHTMDAGRTVAGAVAVRDGRVTGASDYWVTDMDPLLAIEVGKRADLVVLDRDLTAGDAYGITDATVTMTIFDGRTVYRRTE